MKTFKLMLAALAVSMFTVPAFAQEPPPEVQDRIRQVEKMEKGKAKAKKGKKGAEEEEDGNGKSKKGKGKAAEKADGKDKAAEKAKGKDKAAEKAKGKSAKEDTEEVEAADAGGETEDRAAKRNANSAKGLDRLAKEERKHLLRLAKINRIAEIARANKNDRLLDKSVMLKEKETLRFDRAMKRLTAPAVETPDAGTP